ncbi:MAG: DUF4177 domain-containing protein [Rhodobacterales bacterium]|nr:DUF4177 domain-containing protein [Rhodobacterales bacterium]MDX5413408.1 DUF4177 domain-containing protein [Rhodobacterales bacterium]
MSYEYRVIPAPVKGTKAKGAKTAEERFALTLQQAMNTMAEDGWEFLRAETLPSEERSGLTGRKTVYHNMLVFRRKSAAAVAAFQPREVPPLAVNTPQADAPVAFSRPSLTAVAEPSTNAPPVPSPRALSGTLTGQDPKDAETARD